MANLPLHLSIISDHRAVSPANARIIGFYSAVAEGEPGGDKITFCILPPDKANLSDTDALVFIADNPSNSSRDDVVKIQKFTIDLLDRVVARQGNITPDKDPQLNGITPEALIAAAIAPVKIFQDGKFACAENALAIEKAGEAIEALASRRRDRVKRGVEGKLER